MFLKGKYIFPVVIIFAPILLWLLSGKVLDRYLSFQKPNNKANILVVEAWLDYHELVFAKQLFKEDNYAKVVVTSDTMPEFFRMWRNGELVVSIRDIPHSNDSTKIEITGFSEPAGNVFAEVEVYTDGKFLCKYTANGLPEDYIIYSRVNDFKTISVRFTNDKVIKSEDRNLLVSKVSINGTDWPVNRENVMYRIFTRKDTILYAMAETKAKHVKREFISLGIDSNRIIALQNQYNLHSKTLNAAKSVVASMDSIYGAGNYSINILSRGPHARRTYLAYKKCMRDNNRVGIQSTPVETRQQSVWTRLSNLHELFGILYIKARIDI